MSIIQLMNKPGVRDLGWLKAALQAAVELEFFTIPPYLTAMWSVKDEQHYAVATIRSVVEEEMTHMALAANLLVGIGGSPRINEAPAIPEYPRPMPGGVKPELIVGLQGLTKEAVRTFMLIEEPEDVLRFETNFGAHGDTFLRIGAFYDAIQEAFHQLDPPLDPTFQIAAPLAPLVVSDLAEVDRAISLIRNQGEGSGVSPADQSPDDLAHFYRFQELEREQRLEYDVLKKKYRWQRALPFPDVYPVAQVPAGGYRYTEVAPEVAEHLQSFDRAYTKLVDELQAAWSSQGQKAMLRAIPLMFALKGPARQLMSIGIPGTNSTYGPNFIYRAQTT